MMTMTFYVIQLRRSPLTHWGPFEFRVWLKLISLSAVLVCQIFIFAHPSASAELKGANQMMSVTYPATMRDDVVDDYFGQKVADPYRWLENDIRTDGQVAAWVAAQSKFTTDYLATLPGRDIFKARLKQLSTYEQFSIPLKKASRYFYQRTTGEQNQRILYVRDTADGPERMLIDPNSWSKDGATALAEWSPSEDGTHLAYAVQDGGTDWRTIHVMNVNTGKVDTDEIECARFTSIVWAKDGAGFFYNRFPEPKQGAAPLEGVGNHAIYFHALGAPQAKDRLVYATPDKPILLHSFTLTSDGRYLEIISSPGSQVTDLTVVDLKSADGKPRKLVDNFDSQWSVIDSVGSKLFLLTTKDAPRLKVVTMDIVDANPVTVDLVPNGGLLIGAVVNQRPDLFAAALAQVGVMDMLRFDKFTAGKLWIDEYGDPAKEEDFRNLLAYSPYHNVKPGKDYPAIIATTADTDDRVVPAHTFKYIAALQAADIGSKPHIVRIETRAGHGAGKPADKAIAEAADLWAFAAHWTGLKLKAVK